MLEDFCVGLIQRLRQHFRASVLEDLAQMFERDAKSQELTKRIPA